MINIKFNSKQFKIYANGRIVSETASKEELETIEELIKNISSLYRGPEYGFLVSNIVTQLKGIPNIKVISYRDYELENAPRGRVY